MKWRALLYIVVIGPLHYLATVAATLPAVLLLPPDISVQMAFALPVFCALLSWSVPALMHRLELLEPMQNLLRLRIIVVAAALLIGAACLAGIVSGLTTPIEATALNLAALICTHTWLIRTHLRH